MKKFIASVLLVAVIPVMAAVPQLSDFPPQAKVVENTGTIVEISTTAFGPDGTIAAINGQMMGLEYAPLGDYRVRITNGKGFKGERFGLMICTVKNYLEDVDDSMSDSLALSTAFTDMHGKVHNHIGYYSGSQAIPSEGYKVLVRNGENIVYWNSLKCVIK